MSNITISNGTDNEFRLLLPFYVYVLTDPSNGKIFYVGKGKGERALDHAMEVRKLLVSGTKLDSAKHKRIKEILDKNLEPSAFVIARFDEEVKAHAVESVMINFVYDYDGALTNAVRGHGAEFVRRYGDWQILPGIDIPERVRSHDGTFKNKNVEALSASGAYDLLDRIRQQLTHQNFAPRGFAAGTPDRSFDPGESNGWLGLIVPIHDVDFLVSFSKSCNPTISVANTVATRNQRAYDGLAHIETFMGPNFHISQPKNRLVRNEGIYRDFGKIYPDGKFTAIKPIFEPDNLEALYKMLDDFRNILSSKHA